MSREVKLDLAKEGKVEKPMLDLDAVEMVFGKPDKNTKSTEVNVVNEHRRPGHNTANSNNTSHKESNHTQPLLEPDRGRQKPPLAGPEMDDLDDEKTVHTGSYPGIDDGLLEPEPKKPDGDNHEDGEDSDGEKVHPPNHDEGIGTDEGKWWHAEGHDEPDYPIYDGFGPRFGVDDRPISPIPGVIPDVNTYQQKKNLAQGMMDLALFTANVNQLRYVIETSSNHRYYYFSLGSITLSLLLQVAVAVGLIMNSRYDVKDDKDICKADKINNLTVLGIFLVTIVNVFIASFSVAPTNTPALILPLLQQATSNITRA